VCYFFHVEQEKLFLGDLCAAGIVPGWGMNSLIHSIIFLRAFLFPGT
jgi:hypothetical protein